MHTLRLERKGSLGEILYVRLDKKLELYGEI